MTARLWRELGIDQAVTLQLNSLGTPTARAQYRSALVDYLSERRSALDEDSQRRLETNPLRILDSKSPETQRLLDDAPSLADYLDDESRAHFAKLQELLKAADVSFEINTRLVRGLDYYSNTVFEWVTDQLGAQGTVCAGGRYDGLVEQLGGKPTPAVGFGMGIERLLLLLRELDLVPPGLEQVADVYVVAGENCTAEALGVAELIRSEMPFLRVLTHCGGGSFKSQMKKADRSGAAVALILGEDEVAQGQVTVKYLRDQTEQVSVAQGDLADLLKTI